MSHVTLTQAEIVNYNPTLSLCQRDKKKLSMEVNDVFPGKMFLSAVELYSFGIFYLSLSLPHTHNLSHIYARLHLQHSHIYVCTYNLDIHIHIQCESVNILTYSQSLEDINEIEP